MAFDIRGWSLLFSSESQRGYAYDTTDTLATCLVDGYFTDIRNSVRKNDLIAIEASDGYLETRVTRSAETVTIASIGAADALSRTSNLSDLLSASTARTNLGLGSMALQASSNVSITGGSVTLTPNGGTTGVALRAFMDFAPNVQAHGAVGNGVTDDSTAWNNAAGRLHRQRGDVVVPAASAGYALTAASLTNAKTDKVINWQLLGGMPTQAGIPGAQIATGIFPGNLENGVQPANARTTKIQKYMRVDDIPCETTYFWDGYHVEGFLADNANPSGEREARAFSAEIGTNAVGSENGNVRAFKGLAYATGGNANVRGIYGHASARLGVGFTGLLTGVLGTCITAGNSPSDSAGLRAHVDTGVDCGVEVASGVTGASLARYGFLVRPQTGGGLRCSVAQFAGHGSIGTFSTTTATAQSVVGNTLTLSVASNFTRGYVVSHASIPGGTTITDIDFTTKIITLSAATTSPIASGQTITVACSNGGGDFLLQYPNLSDTDTTHAAFKVDQYGAMTSSPLASATPTANGQMTFEATSNTSLTIKLKGTDGVVRSVALVLA